MHRHGQFRAGGDIAMNDHFGFGVVAEPANRGCDITGDSRHIASCGASTTVASPRRRLLVAFLPLMACSCRSSILSKASWLADSGLTVNHGGRTCNEHSTTTSLKTNRLRISASNAEKNNQSHNGHSGLRNPPSPSPLQAAQVNPLILALSQSHHDP